MHHGPQAFTLGITRSSSLASLPRGVDWRLLFTSWIIMRPVVTEVAPVAANSFTRKFRAPLCYKFITPVRWSQHNPPGKKGRDIPKDTPSYNGLSRSASGKE